MDQYIYTSGLTGDYAIGNGQYTWDDVNNKYANENGCEIRSGIIAVLFNSWDMYCPSLTMLNGPVSPIPNIPSYIGRYANGTQFATTSLTL